MTEPTGAYDPRAVEPAVYERWRAADVFAPDGAGSRADWSKPSFTIIQPPPNVTGALHFGTAARTVVEDLLIRRARMQGRPTLWLPGVDHASIAAQWVLDQLIAEEGETRESLGRERYLERMWRFMEETRRYIGGQLRRLGASADWRRERFTMDEGSARAVRVSFKRLYDQDLAYRAEGLINWCPGCRTSLSDLEVLAKPEQGTLWFVRYHLIREDGTPDPDDTITVATTRPETILGDTGVAVHPDDDRYRHRVGREALTPLAERRVPVIADPVVDPAFGSGAVKITPAHDHADHATGQRHGLPSVDVLTDEGRISEAGNGYAGLDRFEARRRILEDLRARGDLVEERPHQILLGRCQRSDDVVEPRLKTQWFVRTSPMAARAMAAVREGRTEIVPKRFEKEFFHWMENIHDWNVSRQLWWGHRIPAWYCPDGHVTVSEREEGPDACDVCGRPASELIQEVDIFDTWYSSGLWPFSTLGWPDHTSDLEHFYPTTVLETAYDILFFWVARMMMLGETLTEREPFAKVLLSGLVRDPYGQKMSKTKGNVIDPLALIEELGADALRWAIVHGTGPGADQRLDRTRLEGARNFANKLWNASRFVIGTRPAELPPGPIALPERGLLGPAEHWILDRCAGAIEAADRAYEGFQFGEAMRQLHESIWSEYCDWYLELAKVRLQDASLNPTERVATWQVLAWVLDRYLRLLHPVMPHITEEIWGRLPHEAAEAPLLIVAEWPSGIGERSLADPLLAESVGQLLELIHATRNARAAAKLPAGAWLPATVWLAAPEVRAVYEALAAPLQRLARISPVQLVGGPAPPAVADRTRTITVVADRAEVHLDRSISEAASDAGRLERELGQARQLLERTRAQLANPDFLARAPTDVVTAARTRHAELEERIERLQASSVAA